MSPAMWGFAEYSHRSVICAMKVQWMIGWSLLVHYSLALFGLENRLWDIALILCRHLPRPHDGCKHAPMLWFGKPVTLRWTSLTFISFIVHLCLVVFSQTSKPDKLSSDLYPDDIHCRLRLLVCCGTWITWTMVQRMVYKDHWPAAGQKLGSKVWSDFWRNEQHEYYKRKVQSGNYASYHGTPEKLVLLPSYSIIFPFYFSLLYYLWLLFVVLFHSLVQPKWAAAFFLRYRPVIRQVCRKMYCTFTVLHAQRDQNETAGPQSKIGPKKCATPALET